MATTTITAAQTFSDWDLNTPVATKSIVATGYRAIAENRKG